MPQNTLLGIMVVKEEVNVFFLGLVVVDGRVID
jgi:hypothetical protein